MKDCSRCGEYKSFEMFYKNKRELSGYGSQCKACQKLSSAESYKRHSQARIANTEKWISENKERRAEYNINYKRSNKERFNKESRDWRNANLERASASDAKRRASKINRTPKWLTKSDLKEIRGFYKESKRLKELTGIDFHVDHIIPLQNELVSGLHVPTNLQILTAFDNRSKKNKWSIL